MSTAALAAVACSPGPRAKEAHGSQPVALAWRFQLVTKPALRVQVRLEATGSDSAATVFQVSREWGGVSAGGDDISDVRAFGADGQALPVEHAEPNRWSVRHAPGARLVVEYAFAPNDHQLDPSPNVNRRPILDDDLFHAYGYLALVYPRHLDGREHRRFRIEWEGFEAAGWKTVCSFAVGPGPHVLDASLDELREAVYMAGEFDLQRRDVEGRPVWTALAGHEWAFTSPAFADLVQRIVALERSFFQDYDYPYFLVTAIPVGKSGTRSRSLGGTGLTHSFALEMLPDTEMGRALGRRNGLGGLLAHEMFHNWDGHTIEPEEPEELVYWFTEGFTDFYTRRLLLRGGLITPSEYAVAVNSKLSQLYGSPVRNEPNERIRADFWNVRDVERLPYLRGDVVAMITDAAIRRTSGGKRSLDDLMRDLVAEARRTGEHFSTEELLQRIEARSDAATVQHLRAIVLTGATPEIDPRLFEPCFAMHVEPLTPFTLGFDADRSRKEGRIQGLVPGSAAEVAGLRDGQKVVGWDVTMGDATKKVTFTIAESDGERRVSYLPAGTPVPTPQFSMQADSTACGHL